MSENFTKATRKSAYTSNGVKIFLKLAAIGALAFCIVIIRRYAYRLKQKPDDEAMALIRQRLTVLDKVLASHISSDDKAWKISEEEIENLNAQLLSPEISVDYEKTLELTEKLSELNENLENLFDEWGASTEALSELEGDE